MHAIVEIDDATDETAQKLSQQIETIGERIQLVKQSIENVTEEDRWYAGNGNVHSQSTEYMWRSRCVLLPNYVLC